MAEKNRHVWPWIRCDQDQAERLERLEKTSSEYKDRVGELERTVAELARDQAANIKNIDMRLENQAERLESQAKTIKVVQFPFGQYGQYCSKTGSKNMTIIIPDATKKEGNYAAYLAITQTITYAINISHRYESLMVPFTLIGSVVEPPVPDTVVSTASFNWWIIALILAVAVLFVVIALIVCHMIGCDQAAKIQYQAERLESQEKTISEYKERVGKLERTVAALARDQAAKIQKTDMRLEDQAKRLTSQEKAINVTRQRNIWDDVDPIAFNAFITEYVEVKYKGIHQTIVFPFVGINLGSGYQKSTGVFTAPRAGIYLFSTTIESTNSEEFHASIVQNGVHLGGVYANPGSGHCDQGSTTSVTQLAKGDEVWVRVAGPADASYWGGSLTSFMGCLIFPR